MAGLQRGRRLLVARRSACCTRNGRVSRVISRCREPFGDAARCRRSRRSAGRRARRPDDLLDDFRRFSCQTPSTAGLVREARAFGETRCGARPSPRRDRDALVRDDLGANGRLARELRLDGDGAQPRDGRRRRAERLARAGDDLLEPRCCKPLSRHRTDERQQPLRAQLREPVVHLASRLAEARIARAAERKHGARLLELRCALCSAGAR